MPRAKYNDRAYRARATALKRRVAADHLPCWICGRPIDTTLPWNDAQAFTADHVDPLANGGHLHGELRPAHRGCNSHRGNRTTVQDGPKIRTSRPW